MHSRFPLRTIRQLSLKYYITHLNLLQIVSQPARLIAEEIVVDVGLVEFSISALSKGREHCKEVSELLLETIQFPIKVSNLSMNAVCIRFLVFSTLFL